MVPSSATKAAVRGSTVFFIQKHCWLACSNTKIMALYLVERLVNTERAREVQRYIQYDYGPYPQH